MKKEEKGPKPRYRIVNFEKRKHPRFNVFLPIEYVRSDLGINHGEALNASQGGLLIYLPERIEVGRPLSLKLFFASGFEINTIETLAEVIWVDAHLSDDWGDYRAGAKFVEISPGDMEKLRILLRSLSE